MKTKITLLLTACFMLLGITLSAQAKLGDNPTDVNANALLELESTSQGVLFPRMSSTDRDSAFTSDVPNGLLIYNTTEDCLQVYNSTQEAWNCLNADSGTASITESYQQLSIDRHIISLSNGGSVAIPVAPDNQTLTLNGTALSIRQGNTVDFSSIANTDSQTLSLTGDVLEISGTNSVSLDDFSQDIVGSNFNTTSNTLTIAISNGASQTIDLSYLDNTGSDSQSIANLSLDASNTLTIGITGGASDTVDLSTLANTGTDSQSIANLSLDASNTLTIGITGGASDTVDLSTLANTGTDSQSIANLSLDASNTLTIGITGGASDTVDLSTLANSGTDSQSIAELNFNSATNVLTVGVSGGASQTTSLATLGNTTVEGVLTVSNTLLVGLAASTGANYRLEVVGDARVSGEIYKTGTVTFTHPDYVFESYYDGSSEFNKDYTLPTLEEVEAFVKANKHLPGVQSRADIDAAGRWNISENIRTNLEKVEELYLHTIAQEKEIEALKAENAHYKKTMKSILERLELLEDKK
ncbi:hypothetical protein N9H73_01625 [Flavobacteriaceae bacterium]|nr:hypothetical protein [Flavobacteriaceae bacterium]